MTAATYPSTGTVNQGRYRGTMYGLIGASQKIPANSYVAIVGGYWVAVTATTGLEGRVARCLKDVDNTGGGNGALRIELAMVGGKELTLLPNDGTAPVTATDLGSEVYWKDNQTISIDATGRSKAGRAWAFYQPSMGAVDTTRVYVEIY